MRWGVLALLVLGAGCAGLSPEPGSTGAMIDARTSAADPQEPPAGGETTEPEDEEPAPPDDPKPKPPAKIRLPGPEHEKLHYFEGTWKGKVHLRASMHRVQSRTTADVVYEKICRGFFVSHDYVQHPSNEYPDVYSARGTMTYDAVARKYRMWWFDSRGQMQDGHGTWNDSKLRFEFDLKWGGRNVKMVNTYTILSDTQYMLKMESGYAGEPLDTILDATYTKQP